MTAWIGAVESTGSAVSCKEMEMEVHPHRVREISSRWCGFPSASHPRHGRQLPDLPSPPPPRRQLLPLCGSPSGHGCSWVFGTSWKQNHAHDLYSISEKLRHSTALLAIYPSTQMSSECFCFWLAEGQMGVIGTAPASRPH